MTFGTEEFSLVLAEEAWPVASRTVYFIVEMVTYLNEASFKYLEFVPTVFLEPLPFSVPCRTAPLPRPLPTAFGVC